MRSRRAARGSAWRRRGTALLVALVVAWFVMMGRRMDASSEQQPRLGEEETADPMSLVCKERWSDASSEDIAKRAAIAVPRGATLAVVGPLENESELRFLAKKLRDAGGGEVVVVVPAGASSSLRFVVAAEVSDEEKMKKPRWVWRREARLLNAALDAIPTEASVVLFAEKDALWCGMDALRLVALAKTADLVCARTGHSRKKQRKREGFVSVVDDEVKGLLGGPKVVDERQEATCHRSLRASSSPLEARDLWTGDILPRLLEEESPRVVWPARVFSCWSGLVALNARHLMNSEVPPLRFRTPARLYRECEAPPTALFALDVHRRVQQSAYGAKAILLLDHGSLVFSLRKKQKRSISEGLGPLLPETAALERQIFLNAPVEMPKKWRCCHQGTCLWRPTHLDTVHGDLTAQKLYQRTMVKPTKKNQRLLTTTTSYHNSSSLLQDSRRRRLLREEKSSIPRVIYQTFKSARLPPGLEKAAQTWQDMNPDYSYELFDDAKMHTYVFEHFGEREWMALRSAPSGALKADLWRYLVIGREGGIYADVDSVCERPLGEWLDNREGKLVAALNGPPRFDLSQFAFAAPPGHPVILRAAAQAVDNLLSERGTQRDKGSRLKGIVSSVGLRRVPSLTSTSGFDPELRFDCPIASADDLPPAELLTGPPVFQAALEKEAISIASGLDVGNKNSSLLWQRLLRDDPRDRAEDRRRLQSALHSLVSLRPPFFAGAVKAKYTSEKIYRSELATAGVRHWSTVKRRR